MSSDQFLEECRERLDAYALLENYGAQHIIERGNELIHSCLVDMVEPHHAHGDQSPSAALNKETMLWNCFNMGGGDVVWLVQKLESVDRDRAIEILHGFMIGIIELTTDDLKDKVNAYFSPPSVPEPITVYNEKSLDGWLMIHPYLIEDRQLSRDVLITHRVGYDEKDNTIVIPHFWRGKLVGWQKRKMDHPRWPMLPNVRTEPKYKNSWNFPKLQTLYNFHEEKNHDVIVMESALSVLRWEGFRLEDDGLPPAVSTFGASPSEVQSQLLRSCDTVTIFYDWDMAGRKGTSRLLAMLIEYVDVRVVLDRPDDLDPGEMTYDQAKRSYDSSIPAILALTRSENL